MKIDITWLSDSTDCETCGWSFADGALISFDGEPVPELQLRPHAHCYSDESWDTHEVYAKILEKLGHSVSEEYGDDDEG